MDDITINGKTYLSKDAIARTVTGLGDLIRYLSDAEEAARQVRDRLQAIAGTRGYQLLMGDADVLQQYVNDLEEALEGIPAEYGDLYDLLSAIKMAAGAEGEARDLVKSLQDDGQVTIG